MQVLIHNSAKFANCVNTSNISCNVHGVNETPQFHKMLLKPLVAYFYHETLSISFQRGLKSASLTPILNMLDGHEANKKAELLALGLYLVQFLAFFPQRIYVSLQEVFLYNFQIYQ